LAREFLMDKQTEALVITMEECGELTQACSKVIRTNQKEEYMRELTKEVGDVMCMIDLLVQNNLVDENNIKLCAKKKREKLKKWSNLFNK
jgi:NTP pyrophosphatase (non-canonical NTP hydrolase)